ncbi:MAG TPA: DUF4058 family protein [Planctomycetaceae bacterium]|nr:DUF4058 family protein [Planctomycetaceae bacterium]
MPSPFPGMDPYLERSAIWPDFHDRLITHIGEQLQPLLRPKYVSLTRDRLYVIEHRRPVWPDVSIIRTRSHAAPAGETATAVLEEVDEPVVIGFVREEVREPVIHIIEPAAGNRIVTAIEILSPDNKTPGEGQRSYLQKRSELEQADTNLVEIDLLRAGQATVRKPQNGQPPLREHHYLVSVTRSWASRYELYPISIRKRLPRVQVPLTGDDPDVLLDLQAAFTRCWDAGPYPELLGYDGPPPGPLSEADVAWCRKLLEAASTRSERGSETQP